MLSEDSHYTQKPERAESLAVSGGGNTVVGKSARRAFLRLNQIFWTLKIISLTTTTLYVQLQSFLSMSTVSTRRLIPFY